MKVLDLRCSQNHVFEGWFGSEGDFQSQLARAMVACPICADTAIHKMLSAPRLNLGAQPPQASGQTTPQADAHSAASPAADSSSTSATSPAADAAQARPAATTSATDVSPAQPNAELQAAWLKMVRHVMANTEDVGPSFAHEARKIHYGESQPRSIRGQASREETLALVEEGIAVLPLPVPEALKGSVH